MSGNSNRSEYYFDALVFGVNSQAVSQRKLAESPGMDRYRNVIDQNAKVMREALDTGDFDSLLAVEMAIQKVEIERFAHDAAMVASINKTRIDLAEGIKDYRQLLEQPEAYRARGYREQDRVGPGKKYPLDTMRKALRSQATRINNFAKNPMLYPIEKEFHLLRVALLRRAEKLYESLQQTALTEE